MCFSAVCLSSINFNFVRLHFRHLEQSIFFESCIFKPRVCLAQEAKLVLAIGQELQRIQLEDNQLLNNIDRKLPLFPNLSTLCLWPVLEALGRHFGLSGGVHGCRDAAEHTSVCCSFLTTLQVALTSWTDTLEILRCCCTHWSLFAVPFQPHCKWNSQLYPSLNLNPSVNHKPSWGWSIKGFSLSSLCFLLQSHSVLTAMELPAFLFFNPDPGHGGEVLPDLHWKEKKHHQRTVFLFL